MRRGMDNGGLSRAGQMSHLHLWEIGNTVKSAELGAQHTEVQSSPEHSSHSTTAQKRRFQPRSCTQSTAQCGLQHCPCGSSDAHCLQRRPCLWGGRKCRCQRSPWLLLSQSPLNTAPQDELMFWLFQTHASQDQVLDMCAT